jgi:lysozyme family protein
MAAFDDAVERTLHLEGGFVDDPQDPGGATNWGITIGVFHQWAQAVLGIPGSRENLESLPRDSAVKIYKARYWDTMRLDEVAAIDEAVAQELFDTGVNMGQGTAVKMLQRLLNAFNNQGQHYAELHVDGDLGNRTLEALRAYADRRGAEGPRVLVTALNCLQGSRYLDIVERQPKAEKFFYGWLKHRVAD